MIVDDLNRQDALNLVAGVQGKTDREVILDPQSTYGFRARGRNAIPQGCE